MSADKAATLLVILDGFGFNEETQDNAIAMADTPIWDEFMSDRPNCLIDTSGVAVGLPEGQMGNSEVGHMTLGAGRVIYQDLPRINESMSDGTFSENISLNNLILPLQRNNGTLHIIGLLSDGGVHSHESQIHKAIEACAQKGVEKIFIHAILDGRDTPPKSAKRNLINLEKILEKIGVGEIATVSGRFFAMDRDQRWDRIESGFRTIAEGVGQFRTYSALEALELAYERGETDEFVKPTVVNRELFNEPLILQKDAILFMNFRADRARQITQCLTAPNFNLFDRRNYIPTTQAATLTRYADDIDLPIIFDRESHVNTLGEYLEKLGKTQLRIAETEKYAHVTFFFSGGKETPYDGEERILIPSPKVETYDLQPEMSAEEVTDQMIEAIKSRRFDLIIANYANGDMVGHTGKIPATIKAIETLDKCLGRITKALNQESDQMLITADHGNAEKMTDYETKQVHTAHTNNLVPLVYLGNSQLSANQRKGSLSDVAPTLLNLMDIEIPKEMTGRPLFSIQGSKNP